MRQDAISPHRLVQEEALHAPPSRGILRGGASAGIVAGIIMAALFVAHAAAVGAGAAAPARMVAASLLGVRALVSGPGAIVLGAVLHLFVSAFWGIIFASLIRRSTPPSIASWEGILFGVAVWAVMTFVALPVLDPVMEARVALSPVAWLFAHIVYGVCLLGTPALRRRFAVQAALRRHEQQARHPVGARTSR